MPIRPPARMRRGPFPPPMAECYGPLCLGESLRRAPGADEQSGQSGEEERGREARERRREVDRRGVGVADEVFPPAWSLWRQPLEEAEADQPGEDHFRP